MSRLIAAQEDEQRIQDLLTQSATTAANEYRAVLTPFLDPRAQLLAESVAARFDLQVGFDGGFPGAEHARALFYPDYVVPTNADYEVTILEFRYPAQFGRLRHRDVLGALMNVGVQRQVFGDIVAGTGTWQIAVATAFEPFLSQNLTRVGHNRVHLRPATKPLVATLPWSPRTVVAGSLRLDSVIAAAFKLARGQAQQLVASGAVQHNWREEQRRDILVGEGDVLSVRGYGRVRLTGILGMTGKENWRLALDLIESRHAD